MLNKLIAISDCWNFHAVLWCLRRADGQYCGSSGVRRWVGVVWLSHILFISWNLECPVTCTASFSTGTYICPASCLTFVWPCGSEVRPHSFLCLPPDPLLPGSCGVMCSPHTLTCLKWTHAALLTQSTSTLPWWWMMWLLLSHQAAHSTLLYTVYFYINIQYQLFLSVFFIQFIKPVQ